MFILSISRQTIKKIIWPIWAVIVLITWLYLISTGPGFALYETHWLYAFMMIFGSAVAGFTPEGGGAVAFPILSLYFNITPPAARDFSLAIQSIGMVSAAIWILTRKGHSWTTFRHIPFYAAVNMIGFVIMTAMAGAVAFKTTQMLFVGLALAFIVAYLVSRSRGTVDDVKLHGLRFATFGIFSFTGGCASAMFGTGSDMLIYIALTCYYGMKEKISTDISIVLMAVITVFGIAYRGLFLDAVHTDVYFMWLAAAPVVLFFAPLGNVLLAWVKKEVMLYTVLGMNAVNYFYFIGKNSNLFFTAIFVLVLFITFFMITFYLKTNTQRS
jgi:uncharacterized membrane protein YfcA